MTDLKVVRPDVVRRPAADLPLKQRVVELVDEVHRLLARAEGLAKRVNALTQENARLRAQLDNVRKRIDGPEDAA